MTRVERAKIAEQALAGYIQEFASLLDFYGCKILRQDIPFGNFRKPNFKDLKARLEAIDLAWNRIEEGEFDSAVEALQKRPW